MPQSTPGPCPKRTYRSVRQEGYGELCFEATLGLWASWRPIYLSPAHPSLLHTARIRSARSHVLCSVTHFLMHCPGENGQRVTSAELQARADAIMNEAARNGNVEVELMRLPSADGFAGSREGRIETPRFLHRSRQHCKVATALSVPAVCDCFGLVAGPKLDDKLRRRGTQDEESPSTHSSSRAAPAPSHNSGGTSTPPSLPPPPRHSVVTPPAKKESFLERLRRTASQPALAGSPRPNFTSAASMVTDGNSRYNQA